MDRYVTVMCGVKDTWIYNSDNPLDFKWWFDLFTSAVYKTIQCKIGNRIVTLRKWQQVASINSLARRWNTNKKRVRRYIHRLMDTGFITFTSRNNISIVTIISGFPDFSAGCNGEYPIEQTIYAPTPDERPDMRMHAYSGNGMGNMPQGQAYSPAGKQPCKETDRPADSSYYEQRPEPVCEENSSAHINEGCEPQAHEEGMVEGLESHLWDHLWDYLRPHLKSYLDEYIKKFLSKMPKPSVSGDYKDTTIGFNRCMTDSPSTRPTPKENHDGTTFGPAMAPPNNNKIINNISHPTARAREDEFFEEEVSFARRLKEKTGWLRKIQAEYGFQDAGEVTKRLDAFIESERNFTNLPMDSLKGYNGNPNSRFRDFQQHFRNWLNLEYKHKNESKELAPGAIKHTFKGAQRNNNPKNINNLNTSSYGIYRDPCKADTTIVELHEDDSDYLW